jgi:hypothetical protein
MNHQEKEMVLRGTVTDVSSPRYGLDCNEQVTFSIDGAEPFWAEVRLPNQHGWVVGDRLSISIVSIEKCATREFA